MDTKKLRQKILDLAIHGKLVPQNPNDEPASVLLERIKVEKERLIKEGKIKRSKKSASSDTPHNGNVPFEVPEGWCWTTLREYVKSVTDGDHQAPPKAKEGIPFLVISDVVKGNIDFSNARFVPEMYYQSIPEERKAEYGDLLFTVTGSYGIVIPVETERDFCFQRHIGLIKPIVHNKYLSLLLKSKYIQKLCNNLSTGTAQKTVGLETLRSMLIPVPPFEEQQRIALSVKKWLTLINTLESNTTNLQSLIKHAKSKILDLAIRGKLVPQDPNDEPASELLKRINPNAEIICDNGHYPQLPEGWCAVQLFEVCQLIDGEKQNSIERINLDVKFLRGETHGKTLSFGRYTRANTLLILVDGENSGEVFRVPIDGYQGSTFKQLSINDNMCAEYVLQVINSHRKTLKETKIGSAIPHINKKLFKAIIVPMPPYNEQCRIINAISRCERIIAKIAENL